MCISHAQMPEPCLVLTPSSFVCVRDDLYTCACVFGTHACVNLPLVFSVCVYICMCVWFVLIKFVFHIVACVCVSIINGAARNSHHTHFYSPSLQLCALWIMCTTLQDVSVIEQVSIVALPLYYEMLYVYLVRYVFQCVTSSVCFHRHNL